MSTEEVFFPSEVKKNKNKESLKYLSGCRAEEAFCAAAEIKAAGDNKVKWDTFCNTNWFICIKLELHFHKKKNNPALKEKTH